MRRGLSISLILLLWLGPFAFVLPGIDESRLPFCCRRHGAHHCAMDTESSVAQNEGPVFSASSHCPRFPASLAACTAPAFSPPQCPPGWQASTTQTLEPGSDRDAARAGLLRAQSDRGPPSFRIA